MRNTVNLSYFRTPLRALGLIVLSTWLGSAAPVLAQPPPDAIRQKTEEVFQRPEFRESAESSQWLSRLLKDVFEWLASHGWLFRQIAAIFEWLGQLLHFAPILFWLLVAFIGAVVLAFLILVLRQFGGLPGLRVRRGTGTAAAERLRRSGEFRRESDRQAKLGDYTEAVRFLFLALVYRFDERNRVSFHKEYTNREYLNLLNDRRDVRDALVLLVDILDDHWYGQQACQRHQYEESLAVYGRLAR